MRFVFQHIPKTAGTTFNEVLERWFPGDALVNYVTDTSFSQLSHDKLETADVLTGHLSTTLIRQFTSPENVIACLREPVDRTISQYFYWRNFFADVHHYSAGRYHSIVDVSLDPFDDLLRCIENYELEPYQELRNCQTWQLGYHSTIRNISERDALECAKKWVSNLGCVGVIERYDEFLATCVRMLGVDDALSSTRVEKTNVTTVRPNVNELPMRVRKKIEEANRLDIELYQYVNQLLKMPQRPRAVNLIRIPERLLIGGLDDCFNKAQKALNDIPVEERYNSGDDWFSKAESDLIIALCLVKGMDEVNPSFVEFRPANSKHLVVAARSVPSLVLGIVDPTSHAVEAATKLAQDCLELLPGRTIFSCGSVDDFASDVSAARFPAPDIALVTTPLSTRNLTDELRMIGSLITEDGFCLVEGCFDHQRPHITCGVLEYLRSDNVLAPLWLVDHLLVLTSKRKVVQWQARLRGFLESTFSHRHKGWIELEKNSVIKF